MLQLKNICKSYTTGDFTQVALNDVSISFRDNEFVAILGPSGSGKTTLLNVMGGLDHYDSGDMLVDASPPTATRIATGTPSATTASGSCSKATISFRTRPSCRTWSWH